MFLKRKTLVGFFYVECTWIFSSSLCIIFASHCTVLGVIVCCHTALKQALRAHHILPTMYSGPDIGNIFCLIFFSIIQGMLTLHIQISMVCYICFTNVTSVQMSVLSFINGDSCRKFLGYICPLHIRVSPGAVFRCIPLVGERSSRILMYQNGQICTEYNVLLLVNCSK